ncbi:MAG: glycosyltransferase [Myxococcota bacterium]
MERGKAPRIPEPTFLVVPCYNEAKRLNGAAFLEALENEPNLAFVLVNDGSSDETQQILESLAERGGSRVHVLSLPQNQGKASAVRAGVLRAFELGASVIGYWDADLATPLSAVGAMWQALRDPKILLVLGSRVQLLGRDIRRDPKRHFIGRGFATCVGLALGMPVYDTQCGAKLFRAHPSIQRAFEPPFQHVWTFDVELLARLLRQEKHNDGLRLSEQCVEFPLHAWHDKPGSKIRFSHVPRIAWEITRLFIHSPRWSRH